MANDYVKTQHRWHMQVEFMVKNYAQLKVTDKTKLINRVMYRMVIDEIKAEGGLSFYISQYENETGKRFLSIEELFPELNGGKEKTDATVLEIENLAAK